MILHSLNDKNVVLIENEIKIYLNKMNKVDNGFGLILAKK